MALSLEDFQTQAVSIPEHLTPFVEHRYRATPLSGYEAYPQQSYEIWQLVDQADVLSNAAQLSTLFNRELRQSNACRIYDLDIQNRYLLLKESLCLDTALPESIENFTFAKTDRWLLVEKLVPKLCDLAIWLWSERLILPVDPLCYGVNFDSDASELKLFWIDMDAARARGEASAIEALGQIIYTALCGSRPEGAVRNLRNRYSNVPEHIDELIAQALSGQFEGDLSAFVTALQGGTSEGQEPAAVLSPEGFEPHQVISEAPLPEQSAPPMAAFDSVGLSSTPEAQHASASEVDGVVEVDVAEVDIAEAEAVSVPLKDTVEPALEAPHEASLPELQEKALIQPENTSLLTGAVMKLGLIALGLMLFLFCLMLWVWWPMIAHVLGMSKSEVLLDASVLTGVIL